jgi:hypothetical protein
MIEVNKTKTNLTVNTSKAKVVLESDNNNLVVTPQKTSLAVESKEVKILSAGQQGPAGPPGPQGPQGPQGPPGSGSGSGDLNYTHNQLVSSNVWTITHNLGKNPSVTVIDSGGTNVIGEVDYTSLNVVTLTFSAAFSGRAFLN